MTCAKKHGREKSYTQLDIVFSEKHRMAAHQGHSCLGRHASPGATLAKHHGDGPARQLSKQTSRCKSAKKIIFDRYFVSGSIENQLRELGSGKVVDGHEMARRRFARDKPLGAQVARRLFGCSKNGSTHHGK